MMKNILDKKWLKAISENGDGVSLLELKSYLEQTLPKMNLNGFEVTAYQFHNNGQTQKLRLKRLLEAHSEGPDDYIIINFLQKEFTLDPTAVEGHFSPLGRYDKNTERVLVLDTDSSTAGAYWIDLDTMLKGMTAIDPDSGNVRGLLRIKKLN